MSTTFQEVLIFLQPLIMLGQNEPNPKMPKWCNTTPKIWNGLLFKEDVEITRQKGFFLGRTWYSKHRASYCSYSLTWETVSLKRACDLRASSNDVASIPIFPFSVKFTFSHLIVRDILSLYYEDSYARWSIMEGTIIALMKQILSCSLIGLASLTQRTIGRSLS